MKTVTIRLETRTIAALNKAAIAEGRPLSNLMRRILQKHVDEITHDISEVDFRKMCHEIVNKDLGKILPLTENAEGFVEWGAGVTADIEEKTEGKDNG